MQKDLIEVIKQVSTFLNRTLSDSDVATLANHLIFDNMKKNPTIKSELKSQYLEKFPQLKNISLMRKGVVGSYKECMSTEMLHKFDKWISDKGIEGIWDLQNL